MTTISPMLAQKLNNNQKTSTTTSNYNQVSTKSMPSDKFVKSNKSKKGLIIAASIGAGLVAFGGFIVLAKKGKLGNGCKEFVDNLFKFGKKNTDINTEKLLKPETMPSVTPIETKKATTTLYSIPEINNTDKFEPINAKLNDDVAEDVHEWIEYRKKLPIFNNDFAKNGRKFRNNSEFSEFEIIPHTYSDNNTVIASIRGNSRVQTTTGEYNGYNRWRYKDGKMYRVDNITEVGVNVFDLNSGKVGPIGVGYSEDGRRVVSFKFYVGSQDTTFRSAPMKIDLVSDNGEFTQAQKDVIKIYSQADTKYASQDGNNPLSLCWGQASEAVGDSPKQFGFNLNTLLSAIQTWANKLSDDFDFDKAVEKFSA